MAKKTVLKMAKDRNSINLFGFLMENEVNPEEVSLLRISKPVMNWLFKQKGVFKENNTCFRVKSIKDYPMIRVKIEPCGNGLKVATITTFVKESGSKRYNFPAKAQMPKNEVVITFE